VVLACRPSVTVGRRSFPVAASILWNSLPPDIQSSASLTDFCHRLTTYICSTNRFETFCCQLFRYPLRFRGLCVELHLKDGRTDGRTDGQTDRQTEAGNRIWCICDI